jgi:hypothetical protein
MVQLLSCLVMVGVLLQTAQGQEATIKTCLGGSINWRLENDFEVSRNVTYTLVTFWVGSDFYPGTGVNYELGKPMEVPPMPNGNEYAVRFGNLKVMMGEYTFLFENKFIVTALEGGPPYDSPDKTIIEGEFTVTFQVPEGVYNGNASLTSSSGGPLQRSGIYTAGSVVTAVDPNGALPRCNGNGPSPIPCEIYVDHLSNGLEGGGPNPIAIGLFSTFSLPKPGQTEKFYRGKVRNRNSARISMRPVIWITDTNVGKSNSFMVPAFDRDGDPVKTFVGGSKPGSAGSTHILCTRGNMTSFGCFGPFNKEDGPPYDSVNFQLSLQNKVATASTEFYYSFTMNVSDGADAYALT